MNVATPVASNEKKAFIVHAEEGERINAFGNEGIFKLTGENTGGTFTLMLGVVPPGGGPPLHVHNVDDEFFIIVEGRYNFLIAGAWTEVGPGAVVYLPRGTPHTFKNMGDKPSRHWAILNPSGFETFYARCAEVFAAPGPPDFARIGAISQEHGYGIIRGG
jgi:quercetin dioxygenase-like cupin family protein